VPSYPSGMTVSTRALRQLADALRARRRELRTRWRRLDVGRQALLVVAYLRRRGPRVTAFGVSYIVGAPHVPGGAMYPSGRMRTVEAGTAR
jgi:hypothetical protein